MKALLRLGVLCAISVLFVPPLLHTGRAADDTALTDCDTLAASPFDPDRKADGVADEKLNPQKALDACLAATARFPDNARLHFQLGRVYQQSKRFGDAAAEYRKAADAGYKAAQYNLGRLYDQGYGVPKDDAQAAAWYRKAADLGFVEAQNNLGVMYGEGRGVPQNFVQSEAWLRKAADQGYPVAQCNLGYLYLGTTGFGLARDYVQAADWFRKAADQGFASAQEVLGNIYEVGNSGVPRDLAKAISWYRKAADQGNARAKEKLSALLKDATHH